MSSYFRSAVYSIVSLAFMAALLAGCASELQVKTQQNKSFDFSALHTYSWLPDKEFTDPRLNDPGFKRRLHAAVDRRLYDLGYVSRVKVGCGYNYFLTGKGREMIKNEC